MQWEGWTGFVIYWQCVLKVCVRCICPVADWSKWVVVCVNFGGPCDGWSLWIHIGEFTFFLFFDDLVILVDLMFDPTGNFKKQLDTKSTR